VVPAGAFERRFVVLRVAETHRQDAEWFAPIYAELKAGGLAAMLHDLLHHDLTGFHPRAIVRTPELVRQQEESLDPLDAWWLELLQTGELAGALPRDPSTAPSNRFEEKVYDLDGYGKERPRHVWREGLYDQAKRISPRLKNVTEHKLGSYLDDKGCMNARSSKRRGWKFPPLKECRAEWEMRFPGTTWRDPTIVDWKCEKDE
jgi:hypothetical protein